jgi:hypothetical protein
MAVDASVQAHIYPASGASHGQPGAGSADIRISSISQACAAMRARRRPFIVPREHFWQSFWFTLGLVCVRFAYALRV